MPLKEGRLQRLRRRWARGATGEKTDRTPVDASTGLEFATGGTRYTLKSWYLIRTRAFDPFRYARREGDDWEFAGSSAPSPHIFSHRAPIGHRSRRRCQHSSSMADFVIVLVLWART
jgi:hypothetical protein